MSLDVEAARRLSDEPKLSRLLAALDRDGEETRIVGGAIRNALIGRPVHEIDLATTARPDETARRAARAGFKAVPTGIEHGTVTVVVEGQPFEVTTLRDDVETDGRHAVVRFGRDFARDAQRRDFTVNALSLDRAGRVQDVTGGLADLAARRIRFIGEARRRIREDYLRILRFFRFTAEYGTGEPDPEGFDAAILERDGLARLSRERVRGELLKLLAAPRGPAMASWLQHSGLLGRLVAGVGDLGRLARAQAASADAAGRLAAFLVGSRQDADRLREELRLSNAEHDRLTGYAGAAARLMSRGEPIDEAEARRLVVVFGIAPLRDALAALTGEPRPLLADGGRRLLDDLLSGRVPPPRFSLTGTELIRRGIPAGPELGRQLAAAKAAWIAAGCPIE